MKIVNTEISDVKIIEPTVYSDSRGYFYESFNSNEFSEAIGRNTNFMQDNHSKSMQGVLRGLHYQIGKPQGKLVRCTRGAVYDVAVDLRRSSSTFAKWVGVILSEENKRQLWIPEGFAHGFYVISEIAEFIYKTTDYYDRTHERGIIWNDEILNIAWPNKTNPILSVKDILLPSVKDAEVFK